ncbi:DUF732 domain-containing protein [Mycobacterium parascrofulaceum]|uniref:DUF732 domain-containing protein n=1 Tax=Mycobacterium parascrofulaceum TaxID=240125 RepID=UPI00058DE936|nr:DUF732 domain-containing protein [Mycobacterium parascrofulaceum]
MAGHKRCDRLASLALTSGPLLIAGCLLASPARADANSFLNHAHNLGIHDARGGDAGLLAAGQRLCQELWAGANAAQLKARALARSDTNQGSEGLSPQQASNLVDVAYADLCPP